MNLKNLTDKDLLANTKALRREECELLTRLLSHIREIDRRRLFSAMGLRSIYDYAIKELGYSADEAYRRISAMRLVKEMPEIEKKIEAGSLSLTHLNLAQKVFRAESQVLSREAKMQVIEKLENTTTREAEKLVAAIAPAAIQPLEKIKPISRGKVAFHFDADESVEGKIEKLKGLLAHSYPNLSLGELLDLLCELGLDKWDPARQKGRTGKSPDCRKAVSPGTQHEKSAAPRLNLRSEKQRQYISVELKRAIWRRDQSRCSKCGSVHALEIDHRKPIAMGGESSLENLRLLCRSCNQRSAIESFGMGQMQIHLQS